MSAMEKSDLPEVARKRANKAASAAAEPVERRGGAKENADLHSTVRTQSQEAVSQAQARIREAVTRNRQDKLTALLHHINIDVLRTSFFGLKKTAAPGVDEMTWIEYAKHLEANLLDLHARVHTGAYRALPAVAPEVYSKGRWQTAAAWHRRHGGQNRPAVVAILTPIYESEFLGFSYGFRPKRNQHPALDATPPCCLLWTEKISTPNLSYAAQYLACALPCERFTSALAGISCITRGRCGSPLLHRDGLPPSTFCRFPGAPVRSIKSGHLVLAWQGARVLHRLASFASSTGVRQL
jgi:hypothetical protein